MKLVIAIDRPDAGPDTHDPIDEAAMLLGVEIPTESSAAWWDPIRFSVGDVSAALADRDPEEFFCGFDSSPGATIEEITSSLSDAIHGPAGYRILVDVHSFPSDADMVLVRVSCPDHTSVSTYSVDWDDVAPRDLLGGDVTIEMLREVLDGVVAEANRAMEAAGR